MDHFPSPLKKCIGVAGIVLNSLIISTFLCKRRRGRSDAARGQLRGRQAKVAKSKLTHGEVQFIVLAAVDILFLLTYFR